MGTLEELYTELGRLCRLQSRYIATEDLDGLSQVIAEKEQILAGIEGRQGDLALTGDAARIDQIRALALAAAADEQTAVAALGRKVDLLRAHLRQAGGARHVVRAYRPGGAAQSLVDRYW